MIENHTISRCCRMSVGILLSALAIQTSAQVRIKERVDITPEKFQRTRLLAYTRIPFVAPKAGALAIIPRYVSKCFEQMPPSEYLEVSLTDTTYRVHILPWLPEHVTEIDSGIVDWCDNYNTLPHSMNTFGKL